MSGKTVKLKAGQEVYIKDWPASVSIENLSKISSILGSEHVLNICSKGAPAAIVAILACKDPVNASGLVKHFVCTAVLDGDRLMAADFDHKFKGQLALVNEIFAAVVKAQYDDFFNLGLAKENSPES